MELEKTNKACNKIEDFLREYVLKQGGKSVYEFKFDILYNYISTKGLLISKCPFGVFKSTKKPTKFLEGLLP